MCVGSYLLSTTVTDLMQEKLLQINLANIMSMFVLPLQIPRTPPPWWKSQ